ncbi:MAG: electron transfer flavoprotein subunit beta/FixA family protein [Thermoanaerobaculum sp.]|nr:electron transfer flavoprotein subunit beta/FixA family protein [Thermoanaerobaculum sp.]MDW7967047.1 electron transfer flavoprotein subunit beta/FixA family protein [Thermoanaerobaculum sp.]
MRVGVLVTYVPDTASTIKVGPSGRAIDETGIKWIISPYDEYAVEEAIKLKESRGAEVVYFTYGPERDQQVLRECFARGGDRGVHVLGTGAAFGDAFAIAQILAAALQKAGPFDLIFAGVKGVGSDQGLVGAMVAELLEIPHVAAVTKLEYREGGITAWREIEGGQEVVELKCPCLITAQKGLNEPRYPSLKGIMAAKKMPVETWKVADLGLDEGALAGATCRWVSLALPPAKAAGKILNGEQDPQGAARELARLLREEAKVI